MYLLLLNLNYVVTSAARDIPLKHLSGYSFQHSEVFEIPKFSVDAEYRFSRGNLLCFRDAAYLEVQKVQVVSPCMPLKLNQQKKI